MLPPKGDLAAVEVAFFSPALLIGIYIVVRHGFSRQMGWIYIVILSILRLVGASATLYMDVNNTYTMSLLETAAITSAVGTAPLLLSLMGFLQRINQGMEHKGLPRMAFRPLHLASLAGLVIAIIGGTYRASSDPGAMQTGKQLAEAAAILFLAIFVALAVISLYDMANFRLVLRDERYLMQACVVALPFLLVRIVYTVCSAFANAGSVFYYTNVNVYVSAFMQFWMEALVVCIYIVAGHLTPKMVKQELREGSYDAGEGQKSVEMESRGSAAQEAGRAAPQYQQRQQRQQRPRFQKPESLGDYRPSRLIMNAIRDRR